MRPLRTIPDTLADAAATPHGITFIDRGIATTRSYEELWRAARMAAAALRGAGLRRGDLAALVLTDAEPFLIALFGASIAGVVPALVYPPQPTVDLPEYFDATGNVLRSAAIRGVVADASFVDGFRALRATCASLDVVLTPADVVSFAARDRDPGGVVELGHETPSLDDLAIVQFTSGSTSAPKGVALSHRNIAANANAINGPSGLATRDTDVGVSWLPLYHDMGLVGMVFGALYSCCPSVLIPPLAFVKRPIDWLRAISAYRGTISFAPSFAYDLCVRRVKDRDLDGLDLSSWRAAGCGAEPIHRPTLEAFAEKFAVCGFRPESFVPSYGLAEHVVAATLAPLGRRARVERFGSDEVVGCGRALEGHEIKIVNDDGSFASDGQVGEIVLRGPSVMLGYYKQDARTAETIRRGWLHTGDLGYLADGELFVCGRAKDVIIANGRKYHPQDLEWAVGELEGVRHGRVVAFGIQSPGRADRVVVLVEPKGATSPAALTDEVRRRVSDLFGLYVDEVACAPAGTITRTTSGKLQRAAAKSRYERGELVELLRQATAVEN